MALAISAMAFPSSCIGDIVGADVGTDVGINVGADIVEKMEIIILLCIIV